MTRSEEAALDDSNPLGGVDDLLATFQSAGLPVPPIPQHLAGAVRRIDDWLWATQSLERMDMYTLKCVESAYDSSDDLLAVSHGGHGVNSYFLTYGLVLGQLAVFVQAPWGGVYSVEADDVADMRAQFEQLAPLVAAAEEIRGRWDWRSRLVVVDSPVRGVRSAEWLDLQDESTWRDYPSPGSIPDVLEAAIRILRAGPAGYSSGSTK